MHKRRAISHSHKIYAETVPSWSLLKLKVVKLPETYYSLPNVFSMLKSMSFPLTVSNRTSNFSLQSPEFYSCIQFEIRNETGLLILLNCEAASLTVFTTMFHKEQQASDNLIVKYNCLSFKYLINAALVISLGDV